MLLEMAIADAYGAAFEFIEKPYPEGLVNDGTTYQKHPELVIGNGRYTDDTQMALAVAEELLADGDFSKESLAERFVTAFHRDPRPGYGKRFHQLLQETTTGAELLAKIDSNSTRSGGVMRVGPVGLLPDLADVLDKARKQAIITHDTPEAIMAARAIAAASHYLYHVLGPVGELGDWLEETVPGWAWSMPFAEWASVHAIPVAHAALTAFRTGKTYKEILMVAVDQGGDVDTTAALAIWMASLTPFKTNDLPSSLYVGLETGPYGHMFLTSIDHKLRTKFAL